MNCTTCQGNSEKTLNCLSNALDTIREHFMMMQKVCAEKTNIISQLNKRNEKLHIALDMLRKGHDRVKSSPKRRKFSPKKSPRQIQKPYETVLSDMSPLIPESQDSLNRNIAIQPDDDEEEIITETEPAISPYKPWSSRRKLSIRNCENEQPTNTTTAPDHNSSWLGKVPKDKLLLSKTKMSLTLRNDSPKFKQTRLKFDTGMQKNAGCDKDIIESSPNLYSTLRQAKQSRSLLHRSENSGALDIKPIANLATKTNIDKKPVFNMDDDESLFELCPDPTTPRPTSSDVMMPPMSGTSDTSSVMMLTPATQDIVFVDDSIDDTNCLNTMAFMEEAIKEDDKVSLTKLQKFESELIRKRQMEAAKVKPATELVKIKQEPLTEQPNDFGNESTKLPADFELDNVDEAEDEEEEEVFPQPIVIKEEPEMNVQERYNISCPQCEKFITFMGTNLTDEKIRMYLQNCRHERELENNTPPGFWNPHMVSFSGDETRNETVARRNNK